MSRGHQGKGLLLSRETTVATTETNQQRTVVRVWQKTTKWRPVHVLSAPESMLRKGSKVGANDQLWLMKKQSSRILQHRSLHIRESYSKVQPHQKIPKKSQGSEAYKPIAYKAVTAEMQSKSRKVLSRRALNRVHDDAKGVHAPGRDAIPTHIFGGIRPDKMCKPLRSETENIIEKKSYSCSKEKKRRTTVRTVSIATVDNNTDTSSTVAAVFGNTVPKLFLESFQLHHSRNLPKLGKTI